MNLAPQALVVVHLVHYLLSQIPGEDQNIIRSRCVDRLDRHDRNVHARRVPAVLVRIPIHGEIQEIRTNAAIVEQSIAFARRPITAYTLARILCTDQRRQQVAFGPQIRLVKPE